MQDQACRCPHAGILSEPARQGNSKSYQAVSRQGLKLSRSIDRSSSETIVMASPGRRKISRQVIRSVAIKIGDEINRPENQNYGSGQRQSGDELKKNGGHRRLESDSSRSILSSLPTTRARRASSLGVSLSFWAFSFRKS